MNKTEHQKEEEMKNIMTAVYIDRLVDQTRMRLREYASVYKYAHPSNLIVSGKHNGMNLAQMYQTTAVANLASGLKNRWLLNKARDARMNNTVIVVRDAVAMVMLNDAYPESKDHFWLLEDLGSPEFIEFKENKNLGETLDTLIFESYGETPMPYNDEVKFYDAFFDTKNAHLTGTDVIWLL